MSEIPTRKRKKGANRPGLNGPDKTIIAAATQEKRRLALGLRKQKMTYADIAKALDFSTPMTAWRYVQDALADIPMEVAAEVKQLEVEDCRDDLRRLNERLAKTDLTTNAVVKALSCKAKLREQLARYLGLYAPTRTELTGRDGAPLSMTMGEIQGMSDEQLERAVSSAGRRSGASGPGARAPASASRSPREPH